MTGSRSDADDLSQEAIARAIERERNLAHREGLDGWLLRIATTLCLDHVRRPRIERRRSELVDPVEGPPLRSEDAAGGCRPGARLPPRGFGGERGRHRRPVEQGAGRQQGAHRREPDAVAKELVDRHGPLPRRGELGPIAHHRRIEVELPAVLEEVGRQRDDALGRRVDMDERVASPRPRAATSA